MPPGDPDWILRLSYPSARRDLEDRVERLLFLSGSSGSSIDETGEKTVVRLYFVSVELREEACAMIPQTIEGLEVELEDADHVDWLEYYEHSLEPIEIGEEWLVVPDRRLLPDELTRTPLVIPQERAFGTGAHESTALCLAMLERVALAGRSAIDIGTGSGILAIAMEKRGAVRVVAFDNDADTWGVVAENMLRNDVPPERIEIFYGTIDAIRSGVEFDLVMMNIIPEVILPALPEVASHVAPGGVVIFSGILRERSAMVIDRAAEVGLRLADHSDRGEWWCGKFKKLKIEN